QRFLGLGICAALGALAVWLAHPSMNGMILTIFALPFLTTALVGWLVLTPFLSWSVRFGGLIVLFALGGGLWDALRFDGTYGEFAPEFSWRWSLTPEQQLLADIASGKVPVAET